MSLTEYIDSDLLLSVGLGVSTTGIGIMQAGNLLDLKNMSEIGIYATASGNFLMATNIVYQLYDIVKDKIQDSLERRI